MQVCAGCHSGPIRTLHCWNVFRHLRPKVVLTQYFRGRRPSFSDIMREMRNGPRTLFFAVLAGAMVCAQPALPPKLEPKLLLEDFRIARAALEEGHSGIYRYTS